MRSMRPNSSPTKDDKMGNFESLQDAQEFFRNDRFATDNGAKIDYIDDER